MKCSIVHPARCHTGKSAGREPIMIGSLLSSPGSSAPLRPAAAGFPAGPAALSLPASSMCATRPRADPSKARSTSRPISPARAALRVILADQTYPRGPSARSTSPLSRINLSIVAIVVVATGRFCCKSARMVPRSAPPALQRTFRISSSPSVGCVLGVRAMLFASVGSRATH